MFTLKNFEFSGIYFILFQSIVSFSLLFQWYLYQMASDVFYYFNLKHIFC